MLIPFGTSPKGSQKQNYHEMKFSHVSFDSQFFFYFYYDHTYFVYVTLKPQNIWFYTLSIYQKE